MAFAAKRPGDLQVDDLRGGMNDSDPPSDLAEDQVVLAENIEFFSSCLGERRNGCEAFDLTSSGLDDESVIVHLSQWFPTNEVLKPEFIAIGATPTVSASIAAKRSPAAWAPIAPVDALDTTEPDIYQIETQSLNGKLFVAYHSPVDRLHVWEGSAWRRAGLTTPPGPPTGVDTGTGTYATIRYFRVRYATLDGTVIKRRSEASPVLEFTPSGTGSGVAITRPALINEGETHWELEASDDNATFYRIATTPIATDTITDSSPFPTDYAVDGVLSDVSGANITLPSAKFLAVDGDRLLFGSHWTDKTKQSLVGWTPVANDPGVGNDERLPLQTNNTVNLDNYDGGALTGMMASATGTWYAFKWQRVYKFVRTGDYNRAYDVLTLSTTRGAIPGSIVRGVDEAGQGVVYFLDPTMGPSRLGPYGIQAIVGMHGTWGQVNLSAEKVVSCGTYYPYKQQVHWWIATNGSNFPNRKLILQVNEIRPQQSVGGNGVGRGWSIATGRIAEAYCASTFTERVSIDGIVSISDRPFIGLTAPDFIQRCDVASEDAGVPYRAILRSRPYLAAGLLNRWGAMTAALLATTHATATIVVKFIRDFGIEEHHITTPLASSVPYVIKDFDDLMMSESRAIQFELSDPWKDVLMLLFMDGQAHYDSPRIGLKYSALSSVYCTWTVDPSGRFGNAIKRVSTSNGINPGYLDLAPLMTRNGVWSATPSGVFGFAIKIDDLALNSPDEDGPGTTSLFAIMEGSNFHLKVALNPSGTFSLVRAAGPLDGYGYVEAVSAEGLASDTWMYVEFKWLIHASAGTFEIRVNTVPVMTYSGPTASTNPSWTGLGVWNTVRLLNLQSQLGPPWLTTRHCDLYLADLASTLTDDVADFLGDGVIETIMPNGVGSSSGWTPSAGANWDTVNDSPAPDDDATYVSTTAVGTTDLYHFEDVPAGSEIKGVHINILARKETEGSTTIAPIVHPTTVDYLGSNQGVPSLDYDRYITQAWDLNPETGVKFTAAEINAGQFGVQKMG